MPRPSGSRWRIEGSGWAGGVGAQYLDTASGVPNRHSVDLRAGVAGRLALSDLTLKKILVEPDGIEPTTSTMPL